MPTIIKREDFLNDLNQVKPGLSVREFLEQSTCVVFNEGAVMTFNDEVYCRKEMKLNGVVGAVNAQTLFAILEKMNEDVLEICDGSNGELEFRGKKKAFGIAKDKEIFLPVDRVEKPGEWTKLPDGFCEAVDLVRHCVGTDETKFILTCVHIEPRGMEACDNLQAIRVKFKTGVEESIVTKGTSLMQLQSLDVSSFSVTKSWMHFRNKKGLTFSCRRYSEEFPKLDGLLNVSGDHIAVPRTLSDAADRAAVFADTLGEPLINVRLEEDKIRIKGVGALGWYKEVKKVDYKGQLMEFVISAHLLKYVSEQYQKAEITERALKVTGDRWSYITALGKSVEKTKTKPKTEEK